LKTEIIIPRRQNNKINPRLQNTESDNSAEAIGFKNEFQFYGSNGLIGLNLSEFIHAHDTYFGSAEHRVNVSKDFIFDIIDEKFNQEKKRFNFFAETFYIFDEVNFVCVNYDLFDAEDSSSGGLYSITINSLYKENVEELLDHIKTSLAGKIINSVNWAFMTKTGNVINKEMQISDVNTDAKDEFYPWIREGLDAYYNRYMETDENVLLLIGIPGTGKTTLIKNLLKRHKMNAVITYDEKLMGDDQFFLDFVRGDKDILIIEDADTMIMDRDKDNNTLLAKILNVSDGLIKNINKKIVFSTNITDKERIDSALMRPGRCFDVMDFRALTYEESLKVLEVTKMDKEINEDREYTLAELLSSGNRETKKAFKFGFGR
jgi:hypothetical protein